MFGYVNIEKQSLQEGQRGLWQTFMCGLCFSTKNLLGNFPRTFISNDVNFFNVLFHSVKNIDAEIENGRCFSSPVTKRTLLKTNELTNRLAMANVLLAYWNLYDDVVDGGSLKKKSALKMFKGAYNKAKAALPELDTALDERYKQLRELEKSNCASIDEVCHSFASLSQDFCRIILAEDTSEFAETLCYNLGKWIYLIDALDDVEKDVKRGDYNVFVKAYGVKSYAELSPYKGEIQFVSYAVLNRIAQSYNDLNLTKYTCILQNVLFAGIRNKTKEILDKIK